MEIISICISIIGVLVAVGIACWTSRSSAKDTARQIAALEESTNRQIESMKQLAKIQIESTSLILEKELWDAKSIIRQTQEKSFEQADDHFSMMGMSYDKIASRMLDKKEKERDLTYQNEFYDKQAKFLNSCLQRLEKIKNDLAIS